MHGSTRRPAPMLVAALAILAAPLGSYAQTTTPRALDCGPFRVNVGDFVTVNVGYPERDDATPTSLRVRLLDADGGVLVDQALTLTPGQSRTVRWPARADGRTARQVLVRGRVLVETGPTEPRLHGTIQVFGRGLTYGPHFSCSGDTGSRGPV